MCAKKNDVENYDKPFAKRLRALLSNENEISPLGREVTRTELSKAFSDSGITVARQTISLYTNGNSIPDIEKFKFIADFFGVSYDYLLGESASIKREFIDIADKTGLSDEAIDSLSSYYRTALEYIDVSENISGQTYREGARSMLNIVIIDYLTMEKNISVIRRRLFDYLRSIETADRHKKAINIIEELKQKYDIEEILSEGFNFDEFDINVHPSRMVLNRYRNGDIESFIASLEESIQISEWRISKNINEIILGIIEEMPKEFIKLGKRYG